MGTRKVKFSVPNKKLVKNMVEDAKSEEDAKMKAYQARVNAEIDQSIKEIEAVEEKIEQLFPYNQLDYKTIPPITFSEEELRIIQLALECYREDIC